MTANRPALNTEAYAKLLSEVRPTVIKTEEENERVLTTIHELMKKSETRTPEENELYELLITLVEKFEERYELPKAEPHEVLGELMAVRNIEPKDLYEIFGSKGYLSDVLNKKREISKPIAKKLAEFFKVSVDLFI